MSWMILRARVAKTLFTGDKYTRADPCKRPSSSRKKQHSTRRTITVPKNDTHRPSPRTTLPNMTTTPTSPVGGVQITGSGHGRNRRLSCRLTPTYGRGFHLPQPAFYDYEDYEARTRRILARHTRVRPAAESDTRDVKDSAACASFSLLERLPNECTPSSTSCASRQHIESDLNVPTCEKKTLQSLRKASPCNSRREHQTYSKAN